MEATDFICIIPLIAYLTLKLIFWYVGGRILELNQAWERHFEAKAHKKPTKAPKMPKINEFRIK